MRKVTLSLLVGLCLALLLANPTWATQGRVGTTCTPCHTDGRTNPPKTATASKSVPAKPAPAKTEVKKTTVTKKAVKETKTKKVVLPAGIISKGAFSALINQPAPPDAEAALIWQEAAKIAVIAAGSEKQALALKATEINHILADYNDQDKVAGMYRPYVAIAVKKGLINGAVIKGEKYFYPTNMAQEIYAQQIAVKAKALAAVDPQKTALNYQPVRKTKKNHDFVSVLMGATGTTVANTCEMCHPGKTDEVTSSVHYLQLGQTTGVKSQADEMAGMWSRF